MSYEDIMGLQRPESSHPRMHRGDRAKLFAPFAALSGHTKAVQSRETVFCPKVSLTSDSQSRLNEKLLEIRKGDTVTAVYFVPGKQREGETVGIYQTVTDQVLRVDPNKHVLYFRQCGIAFEDLLDIRACRDG